MDFYLIRKAETLAQNDKAIPLEPRSNLDEHNTTMLTPLLRCEQVAFVVISIKYSRYSGNRRTWLYFPIRLFSECKDNANRVKFQRKTRFSLHFRDEAYLRALLRDNANILSAQILNGKSYVIIISLPSFLILSNSTC